MTLGWVSFLTDVASDMIYPLLPAFLTRTLGAGPAVLGLVEGVAESTASLAKTARAGGPTAPGAANRSSSSGT